MRISHRNQMMSQLRNMNTTLSNLTNSNNRMSSQRKFDNAYEDVAAATKAMRVRKNIRDKDFYMENIRDARGSINSAEDALQTSVNILRTVTDRVEQGLNGTYTLEDREKIATEISNLQEEVLALMNSSYTDHFVFDAAGGAVKGEQPFKETLVDVPVFEDVTVPVTKEVVEPETIQVHKPNVTLYDKHGNMITEGKEGETYYLHSYGEQTAELCQQKATVSGTDSVDEDGNAYFNTENKVIDTVRREQAYEIPDNVTIFRQDGTLVPAGTLVSKSEAPLYDIDINTLNQADPDYADQLAAHKINFDHDLKALTETKRVQKTEDLVDENGQKVQLTDKDGRPVYNEDGSPAYVQKGITEKRKTLSYHGMPVDELQYNKETGKVEWYKFDENGVVQFDPDTGKPLYEEIPYNEQNYIDIGLGHKFMPTKDGQKINPETVFQFTLSGAQVFGLGKTDGMSNNMYSLLGEIVTSLKNDDMDTLGKQFDHLHVVRSTLLTSLTEIGVRTNFLDDMESIHKNDKLNYQTRQRDLEAIDLAEESMYNKNHEMAWMVTLQLGSKVLPSSLFDFVK